MGAESIADIFSVFHDGGIARYSSSGNGLNLDVEIRYLAERVDSAFRHFHVCLHDVRDISFSTWPKEAEATPSVIRSLPEIFAPDLAILSGETDGEHIKIICNQSSADYSYCGGELRFSASGATVHDERGKGYSVDELHQLCKAYWDEWSSGRGQLPVA